MATNTKELRKLEGHHVNLTLADGTNIDQATLISAGRGRTASLWIYTNHTDTIIPLGHVVNVWEPQHPPHHHTPRPHTTPADKAQP